MTKKQILKILEVAAIVLILLGIIAVLIYRQTTKADESTSGKIPLDQFTEQIAYDSISDDSDINSISDSIGDALYEAYLEQGIETSDNFISLSKDKFIELVYKLDEQGLLTYDNEGNLSPESKAYLSEIAAYSYSDSITENSDEILVETGDTLNEIVDMKPSTDAVNEIASSYNDLFSKYDLDSIEDRLLSLENARETGDADAEAIAALSLKIKALETSVNAIKNTPVTGNTSNDDTVNGCVDDIKSLKTEINNIKNNMNSDSVSPETLNSSVNSVVTKLDNVTTKLNNSNANFNSQINDLSTKIAEKQTAINNLKKEISTLESNNKALMDAKDNNNKEINSIHTKQQEADKKLDTLSKSQSATDKKINDISNSQSEQKSATDKSLTALNNNLATIQKEIKSSLTEQNQELNSIKSRLTSDIDTLKKDLEKEVNDKLSSTKWIKKIEITPSEWTYDNTEGKYIYSIHDDIISEQYSNIYITFGDNSIHNRFSYKQTNKCLTILCNDIPEYTVINSIKIENPR